MNPLPLTTLLMSIGVLFPYHPRSDHKWLLVIRWWFLSSSHDMKLWAGSARSLRSTFRSSRTCNVLYSRCYNERPYSCREDFRIATGCWRGPQWWVSAWDFLSQLLISLHPKRTARILCLHRSLQWITESGKTYHEWRQQVRFIADLMSVSRPSHLA